MEWCLFHTTINRTKKGKGNPSAGSGDVSHKPGGSSGGHTGGASGSVHQGPRPLGAHQRGPDSNFFWKINIKYSAESGTDDIIYQSAASLVGTYFNDLSDSFTTQLLSFRALFKDDIKLLGSQELLCYQRSRICIPLLFCFSRCQSQCLQQRDRFLNWS